jgi:CIC family chloride channel protein
LKVADLAVEDPITVFPDEPIWLAIQKMSPRDLARLPVVARDGSGRLCGIISRSDILRAYDVGIVRRQRGQIVEHQVELRKSKENGYVEFVLKEEDTCSNAMVKDLSLPETINMVSIKRGDQILIPRGHTQLNVGDVITVYGRLKDIDGIRDFLNACQLPDRTS